MTHSDLITIGVKNHPAHLTCVGASAYKCAPILFLHSDDDLDHRDGSGLERGDDGRVALPRAKTAVRSLDEALIGSGWGPHEHPPEEHIPAPYLGSDQPSIFRVELLGWRKPRDRGTADASGGDVVVPLSRRDRQSHFSLRVDNIVLSSTNQHFEI